jgi:MerR HTH family regulatory protein
VSYYSEWYAKNKNERNRRRRLEYFTNSAYRIAIKAKCEVYRKKLKKLKKNNHNSVTTKKVTHNNKLINVYKIGQVAVSSDVPVYTVRGWEIKGFIPQPTIKSKQRLYTKNQYKLIITLANFFKSNDINSKKTLRKLNNMIKHIASKWEIV